MSEKFELDLQSLFDSLKDEKLSNNLDVLLSKIFGLLVMFLDDEITPQQRQIWFMLCQNYPQTHTGLEIADGIGASKISKGIYSSIRALQKLKLITIDESHPRTFSVQANSDHTMSRVLIELCSYYGQVN